MEGQQSKYQVLHKQATCVVVEVLGHPKRAADSSHPVLKVAKFQEYTTNACGVALRKNGKSLFNTQGCMNLNYQVKIGKKYKHLQMDFDKNVL
jgi:hypothetical protein